VRICASSVSPSSRFTCESSLVAIVLARASRRAAAGKPGAIGPRAVGEK
jgi:hypothetical protein